MKFLPAFLRFATPATMLGLLAVVTGCASVSTASNAPRKPIPLAPVGVASPGIGGPGGDSEDTRAVGSVATGEGDEPYDSRSGVAPVTAAPGSVRSAQGRY